MEHTVYALDSTTIDLCLSLFPWAKFRKRKAGVKLNTLLDLRGNIPTFIRITEALVHDVNILDDIIPEAGAFYIMDRGYPEKLRRIYYVDKETEEHLLFLTNCFTLPAITIARLYKCRWQVELFFKWIKQHLRIKTFLGTSKNAVKTQIWIAISVYVLMAIIKKQLNLDLNLYRFYRF